MAYTAPAPAKTERSGLMTGDQLAKQYGNITYDEDAIRSKFDNATKAEYAVKRKEYANTENQFSNQMYNAQTNNVDALRRANASAISTGASKGMQAAQELKAMLGMQDASTEGATELARARTQLVDKEAAAYSQNVVDALTQANTTKAQLGTLGANLYAADTQFDVGAMQQAAQMDANAKSLQGVGRTAEATEYMANQNRAGQVKAAQLGKEGVIYNADQSLLGNQAMANSNYNSAKYNADANLSAAEITSRNNLLASMDTARQSRGSYADTAAVNLKIAEMQKVPGMTEAMDAAVKAGRYDVAASYLIQGGLTTEEAQKSLGLDKNFKPIATKAKPNTTPTTTANINVSGPLGGVNATKAAEWADFMSGFIKPAGYP